MNLEEFAMEQVLMFISTYGPAIIQSILSAVLAALGAWIGKIYKTKINDETKRKVVRTCCAAINQLYKDLDGPTKYALACDAIEKMLTEKGITITALEIEMLIEEVCYDFKQAIIAEIEAEPILEGVVVDG